ncbi:hypothetical protein [Actinacidiphila oryziradicis]|uniref:Uncharacterized protein n=1 Tax=Actinacidiphila oryziradicis TaxID=2571141 RepID=A0A4U0SCP6_9ACTN|nr:hypothetical protein [Actinacidiphila oryziradicis]TKA06378.1 hypothetical protein FCI23_31825 [Actinacidiphila oryziradicis]
MPAPAVPDQIAITLPGIGTLAASVTADPDTGAVRYAVRGTHLHGVFLVRPYTVADELVPAGVRVSFGDGASPVRPFQPRPDEPVAFRVRAHGTATCTTPGRLPDPGCVLVEGVVLGENYATRRVPDAAGALLDAAVLALLQYWHTHSGHADRVRAAARHAAPQAVQATRTALANAEAELSATRQQLRHHHERLLRFEELSATPPPPAGPAAGTTRVPYTDHHGQVLGTALVRETAVNRPPGTVTYRVDGARLTGSIVIRPYRHSTDPVPGGVSVQYGTGAVDNRSDEPSSTACACAEPGTTPAPWRSPPSSPESLPRASRAEPRSAQPVPEATKHRWWAVVRALATRYTNRPDIDELRLTAAHDRAAQMGSAERHALAELWRRQAELATTVARLHERLAAATTLLDWPNPGRPTR